MEVPEQLPDDLKITFVKYMAIMNAITQGYKMLEEIPPGWEDAAEWVLEDNANP